MQNSNELKRILFPSVPIILPTEKVTSGSFVLHYDDISLLLTVFSDSWNDNIDLNYEILFGCGCQLFISCDIDVFQIQLRVYWIASLFYSTF